MSEKNDSNDEINKEGVKPENSSNLPDEASGDQNSQLATDTTIKAEEASDSVNNGTVAKQEEENSISNLHLFDLNQIKGRTNKVSEVNVGDHVKLGYRIVEGDKERVQAFEGLVISKKGGDSNIRSTVTIRRVNQGYAVERVFPCFSPRVDNVKVLRKFKIRRAKLFYLRALKGKKSRLKEKR